MTTRFDTATAIAPDGEGFTATVDAAWTIGGKPNGGYLLAMLGRAAVTVSPHPDVLTASAVFLRSPDPGPVRLSAEVLRAGRSASQLRARLSQDGRDCVEALFTTTTLTPDVEPYWDAGVPVVPDRDPGRAIRIPSTNPAGFTVAIMDEVDLRIDRETLGFGRGQPSGRGELHGWLGLNLPDEPGATFDSLSLLYGVDAFPPATFDIEMSGWVPTLELTVYVRALPAPGPLRVLHRAHLVHADRVDETCWLWDSRGRVVAQSTQLAGIRFAP